MDKKQNLLDSAGFNFVSGERGIRTPGTSQFNGFQDRRYRPLSHLSKRLATHFLLKSGAKLRMFFESANLLVFFFKKIIIFAPWLNFILFVLDGTISNRGIRDEQVHASFQQIMEGLKKSYELDLQLFTDFKLFAIAIIIQIYQSPTLILHWYQ